MLETEWYRDPFVDVIEADAREHGQTAVQDTTDAAAVMQGEMGADALSLQSAPHSEWSDGSQHEALLLAPTADSAFELGPSPMGSELLQRKTLNQAFEATTRAIASYEAEIGLLPLRLHAQH